MFEPDSVWELNVTSNIKFGPGAVKELPSLLVHRDIQTVALITDQGVADAGIADYVSNIVSEAADPHTYTDVKPEPALDVYEDALTFVEEVDPDALIGIGGGSSMDVTKTIGILAEHGGKILEYAAPPTGGGKPIPGPGPPTICVPTTAGTGSETSPVSVIALPEKKLKVGITSRQQIPDTAVVDPTLTTSLPPGPTASSGMDALSHALEAYTTVTYDAKERPSDPPDRSDYGGRTSVTEQLSRKAIELVANNLRQAVNNGQDLTARRNMSLASLLAGIAFTNAGVTANHALAMATGSKFEIPHGTAIAIYLPAVVQFNAPALPEQFADIAKIFGKDTTSMGTHEAAMTACDAIVELSNAIDIPEGIGEFGVTESDVPLLAESALQLERLMSGNPRSADQEDLEQLIFQSL